MLSPEAQALENSLLRLNMKVSKKGFLPSKHETSLYGDQSLKPDEETDKINYLIKKTEEASEKIKYSMKKKAADGMTFELRYLSYKDLKLITDNFNEENLLGGGCHWKLYRGMIVEGITGFVKPLEVTVKIWDYPGHENRAHFKDELALLNNSCGVRSKSMIVELFGFCSEKLALVYECGSVCTLDAKLSDENFTWPMRARAALEIARGLLILEKTFPFSIACSIDPAHILLDKDFKPKLFAFRMDRELMFGHQSFVGNSGVSSTKDHVFEFGTLLLALLEMKAVPSDEVSSDLEVLGPYCNPELLGNGTSYGDLLFAGDLAMECVVSSVNRPSMIKVVACLKGLRVVRDLMWKKRGMKHSRSMYLKFPNFKLPYSLSSNDLKLYTDNLCKSKLLDHSNMLGGRSCAKVYRGTIKQGAMAQEVTVKIWDSPDESLPYFENEMMFLTYPSMSSHPCLVKLIGYCMEKGMLGLVYDLAPVCTLRSMLCDDVSFGWIHRMRIAYGIASTLAFLHSQDTPFLHRNLDPAHIMLDQDSNPIFFEFGLGSGGILGDRMKYHSRYYGSLGLIDPVHFGGTWNTACDVYSFGLLLFSLISCRCVIDLKDSESHISLQVEGKKPHEIVHQRFWKTDRKNALKVTDLAFSCLTEDLDKRPSMQQVVSEFVNWNIGPDNSVFLSNLKKQ